MLCCPACGGTVSEERELGRTCPAMRTRRLLLAVLEVCRALAARPQEAELGAVALPAAHELLKPSMASHMLHHLFNKVHAPRVRGLGWR